MATDPLPLRDEALHEALRSMERALALLDGCDAPAHVGAHLDLAICELRHVIDRESWRKPAQ